MNYHIERDATEYSPFTLAAKRASRAWLDGKRRHAQPQHAKKRRVPAAPVATLPNATGFQHRFSRIPVSAVVVCGGLAVLFKFPPTRYPIYPRCPFFALTHLLCPGCGGTRALYELLHLNLAGALHYNALVTVLAPLAMSWLIWGWYRVWRYYERFPAVPWPRTTALILGSVAVLFAIVRDAGIAFVM